MCVSNPSLLGDDFETTSGIAVDCEAQYEAFRLYSAYGGQEGIPRVVMTAVEPKQIKTRSPVIRVRIGTPRWLAAQC
ncbi:hypothetical protein GCM10011352_01680 [Marinobacterium zhoushanense]|uniref:Uncharacterized protein n=1 Tax=Marinobacterium zhoushanense TaxID=1679163 RepID=A0ABQ1JYW7_9GAMM|nr:hypothetical protein [Marinobacterium zhoushanense]GGB79689.1 hypothetical protein GCM10011352_01680 [Marinobacterium zhoushanense]